MLTGWFTVHRDLLASEYWLETPYDRAHALVDLVGHARFKPGHTRLRGRRIDLQRGQVAWSQKQLAQRWGWSVGKVRRFLDELSRDGLIRSEGNSATTLITILHYDESFDQANAGNAPPEPSNERPKNRPNDTPQRAATPRRQPTKEPRQPCLPREHRQPPSEAGVAAVKIGEVMQGVEQRLAASETRSQRSTHDSDTSHTPGEPTRRLTHLAEPLRKLGVTSAAEVLRSAEERGMATDEAEQLVEEFRRGLPPDGGPAAWGPGALVARLVGKLTTWPTPSDEHRRHRQRLSDRRRDAERHEVEAERRRQLDIERAEQADREQRLGPVLDNMSETDRHRLEVRAEPDESRRRLSRQMPTLHRQMLLETLSQELRLAPA